MAEVAEESIENLPEPDSFEISWADEVEGELNGVRSDCENPFVGQPERRMALPVGPTTEAEAEPCAARRLTAWRFWTWSNDEQDDEISRSRFSPDSSNEEE